MKQVTGSNTRGSAKKVSIQLALDGHSFCIAGLNAEFAGDEPVEVEVLTPRTTLVPRELFAPEAAGGLLAAAGMPALAGERIVWSDAEAEIVAVMAVGGDVYDAVAGKLGAHARFTTPLLGGSQPETATVWMLRTACLLYIKVYDGGLRLAEVIPAPADADVLYFTERLGVNYSLPGFTLRAAGSEAKALCKLIRKRFKTTLCES